MAEHCYAEGHSYVFYDEGHYIEYGYAEYRSAAWELDEVRVELGPELRTTISIRCYLATSYNYERELWAIS